MSIVSLVVTTVCSRVAGRSPCAVVLLLLLPLLQASVGSGSGGASAAASAPGFPVEYKFYTEFQSHEAEFDFLKSVEIEEKINQICWCRGSNGALFLLSTNGAFVWLSMYTLWSACVAGCACCGSRGTARLVNSPTCLGGGALALLVSRGRAMSWPFAPAAPVCGSVVCEDLASRCFPCSMLCFVARWRRWLRVVAWQQRVAVSWCVCV